MGLFGTDGIRGIANDELTPELAYHIGKAGGVFLRRGAAGTRAEVLLGRDTRRSGDMLAAAVSAGLMSAGCLVTDLGVAPTPAVAYLTRMTGAGAGVVISASHNPWQYNGIKFFSGDGTKLGVEEEEAVEVLIRQSQEGALTGPEPARVGTSRRRTERLAAYRQALVDLTRRELGTDRPFEGLVLVVDCAHGAAVETSPTVFQELGATVLALGNEPDGQNINDGVGSLHPEVAARKVQEAGAAVGFAFDGDADRVIAVAADGAIVDGDQVMAVCARDLASRGRLRGNVVVATVMSNMALDLLLGRSGITVERTPVGDREVHARMVQLGASLGGEQSGHIIFADYNPTGDGLLTALQLLMVMTRTGKSLSELVADYRPLPQKLVNVPVKGRERALDSELVKEAVSDVERILHGRGRVLVRPSGTEPVVRVMVEGPDEAELDALAGRIAAALRGQEA